MLLNGQDAGVKTSGSFRPIPEDKYTIQLLKIKSDRKFNQFKGEELPVLNFQFVVLDDKPIVVDKAELEEGEENTTRGKYLFQTCSLSYTSRSNLYKLLAAMLGQELSKDESEKFDLSSLVGGQVSAMVNQAPNKDKTAIFNNVLSFSKCVKKLSEWEIAKEAKTEKSSQSIAGEVDSALEAEKIFGGKAK